MATTTDTLIYELKVKDEASKVFDAWEKRLKDLEKSAMAAGKKIEDSFKGINLEKVFNKNFADNLRTGLKDIDNATKSLFPTFKKFGSVILDVYNVLLGDGSFKMFAKDILSVNINLTRLVNTAKNVGIALKAVFSVIGGAILAPFKMAWSFITDFFDMLKDGFKTAVKYVKDFAVDATKNFLKYEDALLVVARTTGKTWDETKKLGNTLLDMALSVGKFAKGSAFEEMGLQAGIAAGKLAEIAGIAGQLGISATEDIVRFTNVVAKMGVATDITVSKAAEMLAVMANLFKLDSSGIERLASVINELGNTTVATQSQIAEMMRRMGGTASFLGLASHQVAALSATMREAGVTVRVGGTAMSQFMMKMMSDGSRMASQLGLDWSKLKQTLESNDPMPALQEVLGAINDLAQSGGRITVAEKLRDMGITGVNLQDTLLKLAQNQHLLNKNLQVASKEWRENDSLAKEYAKTLETAGHQFREFVAFVDGIKKVIGEDLAKAFGNFTEKYLTPLVEKFLEWVKSKEVQHFLEETLPKALEWVGETINKVAEFFGNFIEDVKNMGPWEAFKKAVSDIWNGLEDIIANVWEKITTSVDGRIEKLKASAKAAWEEMKNTASKAFWELSDSIFTALENVGQTIGDIFGNDARLAFEDFTKFLANIPHLIQAVTDEISRLMPSINEIVDGMVEAVNLVKDIKGGFEEFGKKGNITKESNPELFKPIVAGTHDMKEGLDAAAKSTRKLDDDTKALGITTVGRSVYPDTTEGVKITTQAIEGLSSVTRAAEVIQNQFGQDAVASLNSMATAYDQLTQHINRYTPPTTIANASGNYTDYQSLIPQQPASTAPQTEQAVSSILAGLKPNQSVDSQSTTQTQTTNITFSGYNVVDESSKNRFAREITSAQRGLSSLSVRA